MDIKYIISGKKGKVSKRKPKLQANFNYKLLGKPLGILGDSVTKPQKRAIKKDPWGDWDKDGVINGLDCAPRNKKKHMAQWRYNYEDGWQDPPTRTKMKLVDPKELQRVESDEEKNRWKIERIQDSGEIQEPVKVWNKYDSDQKYQIRDGHHRTLAAIARGDKQIPVEIYDQPTRTKEYRERKELRPYMKEMDLSIMRQREHASKFGFKPNKTLVHGTSLENAQKIAESGKVTGGTLVPPGRGGWEDATTWAKNKYGDKGAVVLVEADTDKPFHRYNWVTLGERGEERKGHDDIRDELKVSKMKVFNLPEKDSHILKEIDHVTPAQQKVLDSGKDRFVDTDKDGVIDGLDCAPNDPNKHMAIRFGRRPREYDEDQWRRHQDILDKTTHKENLTIDPRVKMNTVLANDREVKRLKQTTPFWRDENWHARMNQESRNALREQGYNDQDADEYLASKTKATEEFGNYIAQEMAKDQKVGQYFKGAIPTVPITDREGAERLNEAEKFNKTLRFQVVKKVEPIKKWRTDGLTEEQIKQSADELGMTAVKKRDGTWDLE